MDFWRHRGFEPQVASAFTALHRLAARETYIDRTIASYFLRTNKGGPSLPALVDSRLGGEEGLKIP